MEPYDFKKIEPKWQKRWAHDKLYKMSKLNKGEKKFYSLYSFPYPSGDGLHVGHAEGMVANDILARFWRMKGRKVVLPMGWDSFGLPAENYAIKTGIHPKVNTENAIKTFIDQINAMGISVDWDMEVAAHWPDYYRWTQWIFLQFYKAGLVYKKKAPVNWCPSCKTALANEQVVDGKCERCDTVVVQKDMDQWFFKITKYADRLADDLDQVDWPESTKVQQRNWIGRSEGINIYYQVEGLDKQITVFTTRPDTNFGATFIVVAPDSKFVKQNINSFPNKAKVQQYIDKTALKTELERISEARKKTGEFTGLYAINNLNNKKLPIYVSDFVLATFGTGAVVGVPGHDLRDYQFAKAMGLEVIRVVVAPNGDKSDIKEEKQVQEEEGYMINSDFLNGLNIHEAEEKVIGYLEEKGWGKRVRNYRLRDWLVSRQRYWGTPIPIVYDPEGKPHPVDEKDLPVELPMDVDFRPTGESPLKYSTEFHKSAEEKYGKGWTRETDTMDTFVDSSWYQFRHIDSKNQKKFVDSDLANIWLPVDLYMIGTEHIVLHLLYSRFFTKFFYDKGLIKFDEPFYRLRHMGLILGSDSRKMSKRWGNVINPIDEINKYGADTLRIYEMFMGPLDEAKVWSDRAESGVFKFIKRIWSLQEKVENDFKSEAQERWINKIIKKVENSIKKVTFNTTISQFMEFVNFLMQEKNINKHVWKRFIISLAPFAPYIAEELWEKSGGKYSVHKQLWPEYNTKLVMEEIAVIAIQVNGKLRATLEIPIGSSQQDVENLAKTNKKVRKYIEGREMKKIIYVKNKILSFVV